MVALRSAPNWIEAPDFGRRKSILAALQQLHHLHSGPACIVETGTIRDGRPSACASDGWSTIAWGWYASQAGGKAYTIDIDPQAIETCKRLTAEYAAHLEYVCTDSVDYLSQWNKTCQGEIHLLYLDSFDYHDREQSEAHHLAEAKAALHVLAPACLVLFDDTHLTGSAGEDGIPPLIGKGARAIPFLLEQGFQFEWAMDGQVLLSRGAKPATVRETALQSQHTQRIMQTIARRQEEIVLQTSLRDVPRQFLQMQHSPFLTEYLSKVRDLCPPGGKTCEVGSEAGCGAIWLSHQGLAAESFLLTPRLAERAKQVNNLLEGRACFCSGDLFTFYESPAPEQGKSKNNTQRPYAVIHHQGLLEHFAVPWIQAILAHQVACADYVVFSIPSVYYPFEPEMGDERLLPLEEWTRILAPFDVQELAYYGDPQLGGKEHILAVLRGQKVDETLCSLMSIGEEPYPQGISAIVHTRNEARHIAACLQTLQGWTDEIIICDMESEDDTVQIAWQYTDQILHHPIIANFDRARNSSAMWAKFRWIFYLDADERVPPGLGPKLRELITTQGFEALSLPFHHHFAGKWLTFLEPGYKAPSLFKNGYFVYNARPHAGAQVDGRIVTFDPQDPNKSLIHLSYDSLSHYLDKLNAYTSAEAANMHADGQPYHWQNAVAHFVRDFQDYYDQGGASRDGVHGFLYAFLSGFYRFEQHAKLFECRFRVQQLTPDETAVPKSVEEVLEFALAVARHKPLPAAPPIQIVPHQAASPIAELLSAPLGGEGKPLDIPSTPAQVVWSGPLYDPSGYGEESRSFLFALQEAGVPVAAQPIPWSQDMVPLTEQEARRLQELRCRPVAPGFIQIIQNFPPAVSRHPQAGLVIGRTMFETDRLPADWVRACNRMDYIWVPSEFNKQTFAQAGVDANKLAVIPGCFDPTPYQQPIVPTVLSQEIRDSSEFVFLSIFDWTLHKGWDVLLKAFLRAFSDRRDVRLVLKVWSTMGYGSEGIQRQAATFAKQELGLDLLADQQVRFVFDRLPAQELLALYQAADAFVLPSRGEGWGRPYMEAMACGLPTIGTNWSGNTAFMTPNNSYLLDYELQPVPEIAWREVPTYRGHRWAEPSSEHLQELLLSIVSNPLVAVGVGRRAQEHVTTQFRRAAVGRQMAQEIARLQQERRHRK